MDVVLQSRTPDHGLGRYYPETAAGHGRVDLLLTTTKNGGDYLCTRREARIAISAWRQH